MPITCSKPFKALQIMDLGCMASRSRYAAFFFVRDPCLPYDSAGQNEPEYSNDSYPTCDMPVDVEAQIATALRQLLDNGGYSSVKIIGYDHNWGDAGGYPVQLVSRRGAPWNKRVRHIWY